MRAGRFIPIHFVPICDGASFIGGLIEALTFQNGKRRADYWNRVNVSMKQVAGKWAKSAEAQMLIDGALGFCGTTGKALQRPQLHDQRRNNRQVQVIADPAKLSELDLHVLEGR